MLRFLMSLNGNPPTAGFTAKFRVILSAVRAGYIGPGRGLQRCVGIFLYANRRFHVHERPEEPGPSRVPAAGLAIAALVTLIGGIAPGSLAPWAVSP